MSELDAPAVTQIPKGVLQTQKDGSEQDFHFILFFFGRSHTYLSQKENAPIDALMVDAATRVTIRAVADARSQFVAIASATIARCGVCSPAKWLASNRALCEQFGRDWVTCPCHHVGSTIAFPTAAAARPLPRIHVFAAVSPTLGAVRCSCVGDWELLGEGDSGYISRCLGDDRFLATNFLGEASVVDGGGKVVVAALGAKCLYGFGFWACNRKWLVNAAENAALGAEPDIVVWRLRDGVPTGKGVGVRRTVPLSGFSAKFSQFDPCGDVLAFAGHLYGSHHPVSILSLVDLERSLEAGFTVQTKKFCIPLRDPYDLVWSSPTSFLTLHGGRGHDFKVYNTKTERSYTFPPEKHYREVTSAPPSSHIAASVFLWPSSLCRVHCYAAAESSGCLSEPLLQYEHEVQYLASSSASIFALQIPPPLPTTTETTNQQPQHTSLPQQQREEVLTTVSIHDVSTGKPIAIVTLFSLNNPASELPQQPQDTAQSH
ncbi:hypothetical protein Pelo_3021 [Pelomyxa schiedti]|nr:hypothetical protein Pelo_3021 [Pelomyxa schiedti]